MNGALEASSPRNAQKKSKNTKDQGRATIPPLDTTRMDSALMTYIVQQVLTTAISSALIAAAETLVKPVVKETTNKVEKNVSEG